MRTPVQTIRQEIQRDDSDGEGFVLRRYLQILIERKWLILAVTVLVLGAVAAWTFSRTRIYRAQAMILIERSAPKVLGSKVNEVVALSMEGYWRNKEYMQTQKRIIKSRVLAEDVARRLKLASNKDFWFDPKPGIKHTMPAAASRLLSLVTIKHVRNADLLQVSIEHPKPKIAAMLANGVVKSYIEQNLNYRLSSTTSAVRWLADQLDTLKKQLEKSERALYDFKKNNNLMSVSLQDKQNLTAGRASQLNEALTKVKIKRMELAAKVRLIRKANTKDPHNVSLPAILNNSVIQSLKQAYIRERSKLTALKSRYLEKHPLVRQQAARLAAASKALDREVRNVLGSTTQLYRQVLDQEAKLTGALAGAKKEGIQLNKREMQYMRLKRSMENTKKVYQVILTRLKEANLSAQLKVNNIRMLDEAQVPTAAVRPRVKLSLVAGGILGLLLGIGLALLVNAMDNTVKSQRDVEQHAELVFLGLMPKIADAPSQRANARRPAPNPDIDLIVHRNPKSPVAESCRAIRTNLMFASPDEPMRRIMVTSPGPREGKTTTSVSLAIAMAQSGTKVLLMDTDMRRPRLHKVFGVSSGEGITSVLLGNKKLEEVVKTTEVPNLYLLPCGPTPPNPAELCESTRFKEALDRAAELYDRVILDSPPAGVVTDAVVLSTLVDGTLIVARTGQTSRSALRMTVRQLRNVEGARLGCVLNDMDLEKGGYGYYRYRRYGYYRYGYGNYADEEATES